MVLRNWTTFFAIAMAFMTQMLFASEVKIAVSTGAEKATEVFEQYSPFIRCLNEDLKARGKDINVTFTPVSPTKVMESITAKEFEIYESRDRYYVEMVDQKKLKVKLLAVQEVGGKIRQKGVIFTVERTGVKSLEDLKRLQGDKRLRLLVSSKGSPAHVLVADALVKQGVTSKNFSKVEFHGLSRADAAMAAVLAGDGDVALVFRKVVDKYKEKRKDIVELLEIDAASIPWIAREGLDPEVFQAMKESVLKMIDPKCIGGLKINRFLEAKDSDFNYMREAIKGAAVFEGGS